MSVLAVFFPSLMGLGILASGALLLTDLLHKLVPGRGLRRGHHVVTGAFGIVADAAAAAGRPLRRSDVLYREPRHPLAYVAVAAVACGIGLAVVAGCTAAYRDAAGVFHASPWMIGIAVAGGAIAGLLATLSLVLAVLRGHLWRPLARLVATTPMGRLRVAEVAGITSWAGSNIHKERR
jgi:hypothetical protein